MAELQNGYQRYQSKGSHGDRIEMTGSDTIIPAISGASIPFGRVVNLRTDGTVDLAITSGTEAFGIALSSSIVPGSSDNTYPDNTPLDVMQKGIVLITVGSGAAAVAGAACRISSAGVITGGTSGGQTNSGITFLDAGAVGELVRVRVNL